MSNGFVRLFLDRELELTGQVIKELSHLSALLVARCYERNLLNVTGLLELLHDCGTELLEGCDGGVAVCLEVFFELVKFLGKGKGAFVNDTSGGGSTSRQLCQGRCSPFFKFLHS